MRRECPSSKASCFRVKFGRKNIRTCRDNIAKYKANSLETANKHSRSRSRE
jgi:hypothetical protein